MSQIQYLEINYYLFDVSELFQRKKSFWLGYLIFANVIMLQYMDFHGCFIDD